MFSKLKISTVVLACVAFAISFSPSEAQANVTSTTTCNSTMPGVLTCYTQHCVTNPSTRSSQCFTVATSTYLEAVAEISPSDCPLSRLNDCERDAEGDSRP